MRFSKWILGAALLFSVQIVTAQSRQVACNSCDPCAVSNLCDLCNIDFCEVEYDFYVDALYWEVCKSDHQIGEDNSGKQKYLNPDYDWGYRIGGIARWNSWDLGFRYTSFCTKDSKSSADSSPPDKEKFEFDYDVFDIEFGYTCCLPCGPMSFRPFLGVKMAWIDDDFESDSARNFSVGEAKIDFEGYGLYIGASARCDLFSYCVCDRNIPIALVARAGTGIIRGEFEQDVSGGDKDRRCIYVPEHDLYVGLDFTFCDLCGWDAFFRIGYETQYWGWLEYGEDDDTAHIGFGGLVLRFGAIF